jgi:hypothetical protein
VNQYNRLLRRLQFPACPRDQKCIATVLNIDTRVTHPAIETLDISKSEPHAFAHDIDSDLAQIDLQQDWHKSYGPVRLCEPWTLAFGSEPWHLIRLDERANSTTK